MPSATYKTEYKTNTAKMMELLPRWVSGHQVDKKQWHKWKWNLNDNSTGERCNKWHHGYNATTITAHNFSSCFFLFLNDKEISSVGYCVIMGHSTFSKTGRIMNSDQIWVPLSYFVYSPTSLLTTYKRRSPGDICPSLLKVLIF